jgi:endogenous inhibitor of DNA gyrase (YacG/DUF329 family)
MEEPCLPHPKLSSAPPATNEDFPFCSDRCRILDLGKWASGDYKVSTPIQDPDLLEELARSNANRHPHSSEDAE